MDDIARSTSYIAAVRGESAAQPELSQQEAASFLPLPNTTHKQASANSNADSKPQAHTANKEETRDLADLLAPTLEESKSKDIPWHPYTNASLFSRAIFSWVSPLVKKGHKQSLNQNDLFPVTSYMSAERNIKHFIHVWEEELATRGLENASVMRAVYVANKPQIRKTFFIMCFWVCFFLLTPLFFMRQLIAFVSSDDPIEIGIALAIGMGVSEALRSMFAHQYWYGKCKEDQGKEDREMQERDM